MSMDVSFHLDGNDSPMELGHRVTKHTDGSVYGTFRVGAYPTNVTFFLNIEQVAEMRKELAKLERQLKKQIEKSRGLTV